MIGMVNLSLRSLSYNTEIVNSARVGIIAERIPLRIAHIAIFNEK
jgi:hypothetical protein